MSYLPEHVYESIRSNPDRIVDFYAAYRSEFISDLGMPGLSETLYVSAFSSVVAYGLAPYGPHVGTRDLGVLLDQPMLACAGYVSLTWRLIELFGVSTDAQTAVGWDNGAVGNHAQMLVSDGGQHLLLDPTIGLVVQDVTLHGLIEGQRYSDIVSFFDRDDIPYFEDRVIDAIAGGDYELEDIIYHVPGLNNWLTAYSHYQGYTYEEGGTTYTVGSLYDDVIRGDWGVDVMHGGKGDDGLVGGLGRDVMFGGLGDDVYYVENRRDQVHENSGEGYDTVRSEINYALGAHVEALVLVGDAIRGAGNSEDNMVYGNALDNILSGGAGDDRLIGNDGSDLLVGGSGNDLIEGGAGADRLHGNSGSDMFLFRSLSDTGVRTSTSDWIYDFSGAGGDRLAIHLIDADVTTRGNQAFTFIGTDAFSAPGQIRWFTGVGDQGVETRLIFNVDENLGDFEGLVRLDGLVDLDSSWFLL